MTFDEYQKAAQRTASTRAKSDKIENGVLGLCGESGEVADVLKKYLFQEHELDREKLVDELTASLGLSRARNRKRKGLIMVAS